MNVIFLDIELIDWPVIDSTAFLEQIVEAAREWTYEYPFAILGYPNQMIFEAVGRVSTMCIAGHDLSMPYFLMERQDFVFP